MSFEIERKFLVCSDAWREFVVRRIRIRQAYLNSGGKASIRVRINDESDATLSIKSRPVDLRRLELEYPLPVHEAETLVELRCGAIIDKIRHLVPAGDLVWEVDIFLAENVGLIIAEIELPSLDHQIDLPAWIGREVTGQARYYNSYLTKRPFLSWQSEDDPLRLGAVEPASAP